MIITNTASVRFILLVALFGAAQSVSATDLTHHYVVTVSDDLTHLEVQARLARASTGISARDRDAGRFVSELRHCDSNATIERRNNRLQTGRTGIECFRYSVDLVAAGRDERRNRDVADNTRFVSPTRWLWRPRLGDNDAIIVRFEHAPSIGVSVPWEPLADGRYRLADSPQSGDGMAVFGEFSQRVLDAGGVSLRAVIVSGGLELDEDGLFDWAQASAMNIVRAYGRFPNPHARVIMYPTARGRRSDSPVFFGFVTRDGGETIELLINEQMPVSSYYDNWTATHEFSHLMLPYVDREQRWLSEGFAQYYQNVLLARAGEYSERSAWQKIHSGLERGRLSAPELSPNAAASGNLRDSLMKVYWSGAALALMADVELRNRSNHAESLDTVLGEFQQCCLPSSRAWSGRELFARLDTFVDEPLFLDLYRRYANASGFPESRGLLAELGVIEVDYNTGIIELDDTAPLAELRQIITAAD